MMEKSLTPAELLVALLELLENETPNDRHRLMTATDIWFHLGGDPAEFAAIMMKGADRDG